jgi:hypothetical protein
VDWLYVVVISGSIAASSYPTEEACQGHKVVFDREHKVSGLCVKAPTPSTGLIYNNCVVNVIYGNNCN